MTINDHIFKLLSILSVLLDNKIFLNDLNIHKGKNPFT